jgi:hypothetical protein
MLVVVASGRVVVSTGGGLTVVGGAALLIPISQLVVEIGREECRWQSLEVRPEGGWSWLTPAAGGRGVSSAGGNDGCFSVALPLPFTGLVGSRRRLRV